MSKKHFHGRRHIRAQWTVGVARDKRRMYKMERSIAMLSHFVRFRLPQLFGDVFHPLAQAVIDLRNSALILGDMFRTNSDTGNDNEL